jgi:tnpV protein
MNMEKYKYDGNNGLWYKLQSDYYLPCLKLPEEEQVHIGIRGQRHLRYLKENRRVLLSNLQISSKLNSYLADIDRQAEDMFEQPVKQMAEREDVTEQLKAADPMEWVRRMNNIRNAATEITNNELIFV